MAWMGMLGLPGDLRNDLGLSKFGDFFGPLVYSSFFSFVETKFPVRKGAHTVKYERERNRHHQSQSLALA